MIVQPEMHLPHPGEDPAPGRARGSWCSCCSSRRPCCCACAGAQINLLHTASGTGGSRIPSFTTRERARAVRPSQCPSLGRMKKGFWPSQAAQGPDPPRVLAASPGWLQAVCTQPPGPVASSPAGRVAVPAAGPGWLLAPCCLWTRRKKQNGELSGRGVAHFACGTVSCTGCAAWGRVRFLRAGLGWVLGGSFPFPSPAQEPEVGGLEAAGRGSEHSASPPCCSAAGAALLPSSGLLAAPALGAMCWLHSNHRLSLIFVVPPPRFTPPPDASPDGKPWPLPSAGLHASGPAPAAAAACTDLLLPAWSHEFWEPRLPLPPGSAAPAAPSSPLFQHAGKLAVLCPPRAGAARQAGCCAAWGRYEPTRERFGV